VLAKIYNVERRSGEDWEPALNRLIVHRGAKDIDIADLPDLVTFGDPAIPQSVTLVDPNHLEKTLGAGVSFKRITLEITDERVTSGLETKLPWLSTISSAYLDGQNISHVSVDHGLANRLQKYEFVQRGY